MSTAMCESMTDEELAEALRGLKQLPVSGEGGERVQDLLRMLHIHQLEREMQNRELYEVQRQLEQRVAERTSELMRANAHLTVEIANRIGTEAKLQEEHRRF